MSATLLAQSAGMRAQGDGDLACPLDDDQAFIHVGKERQGGQFTCPFSLSPGRDLMVVYNKQTREEGCGQSPLMSCPFLGHGLSILSNAHPETCLLQICQAPIASHGDGGGIIHLPLCVRPLFPLDR